MTILDVVLRRARTHRVFVEGMGLTGSFVARYLAFFRLSKCKDAKVSPAAADAVGSPRNAP